MKKIALITLSLMLVGCGVPTPETDPETGATIDYRDWSYILVDRRTGCRYSGYDRGISILYNADGTPQCPDARGSTDGMKCVKVGEEADKTQYFCTQDKTIPPVKANVEKPDDK